MRIVHLSTDDALVGSGRAAARLHEGLKRMGHDSMMVVACRRGTDPAVQRLEPPRDLASRIRRLLRRRRITRDFARYAMTRAGGHEPFTDDRTPEGAALVSQLPPCDIVNLHHVRNLLDYQHAFPRLPHDVPVVWRLADMGPLTGGCHYDEGCGRFQGKCGMCPQLGSANEYDLSRQVWQRKGRALAEVQTDRLHLVAPSNWIAEQARSSSLFSRFPISVIPNGLDVEDFAPRDRAVARDALGVPPAARVVLFVGAMHNPRKGFGSLLEALGPLPGRFPQLLLLTVGSGEPPRHVPVPHLRLKHLDDDRLLSRVYSAADVFVMPSRQESFGQTVTEAIACGTPVVGFATGGMLDTVRPGQTGALASVGDIAALRNGIAEMLDATADEAGRSRWATQCRNVAIHEYTLQLQATRFVNLYQRMLRREVAAPAEPTAVPTVAARPADGEGVRSVN